MSLLFYTSGCARTIASDSGTSKPSAELVLQNSHSPYAGSISFAGSSNLFTVTDRDSFIDIWDSKTLTLLRRIKSGSSTQDSENVCDKALISPDGKLIACAVPQKGMQLWNTYSGKLKKTIPVKMIAYSGHAWTPDSKKLAIKNRDGITIYNIADLSIYRDIPGANYIVFSNNGKTAAMWIRRPDNVLLREHNRAKQSGIFRQPVEFEVAVYETAKWNRLCSFHEHQQVGGLAISPDGKKIAIISQARSGPQGPGYGPSCARYEHELKIKLWNRNGKLIKYFPKKGSVDSDINALQFTADGKKIFSAGDIHAQLWNIRTGRSLRTFTNFRAASVSPDGKTIITSTDNISVYNVLSGKLIANLPQSPVTIFSIAFSADGKQILAGDRNSVRLWNADTNSLVYVFKKPDFTGENMVGFTDDGHLFTNGNGGAVFWNRETGRITRRMLPPMHQVTATSISIDRVILSPDGTRKITETGNVKDRHYLINDAISGRLISTFLADQSTSFSSIRCSQDGSIISIFSFTRPQKIGIWDTNTGTRLKDIESKQTDATMDAFLSNDGKFIAISETVQNWSRSSRKSIKNTISIYPVNSDIPIGQIEMDGFTNKIVFSHDNNMIALICPRKLAIYDARSFKEINSITSENENIIDAAFSPDDRRIATGDWVGMLRIWNIADGKQTAAMVGFPTPNGMNPTDDWLVCNADGKYSWSKKAESQIRWRIKGKLYPASAVKNADPDLTSINNK